MVSCLPCYWACLLNPLWLIIFSKDDRNDISHPIPSDHDNLLVEGWPPCPPALERGQIFVTASTVEHARNDAIVSYFISSTFNTVDK